MNLKFLLDRYLESPRISEIAAASVLPDPQKITIPKLPGSFSSFLFSVLYQRTEWSDRNTVIILEDAESAAYFHNDIDQLIQPIDLFYFPSSFKSDKNFKEQSSSHIMLRTEALSRWASSGNRKILVTYPEALLEKVATQESLHARSIQIKVNDKLHVDQMLEKLVGYGFERTDFVFEPGQFAMRGGILDIYSYGNEKPYRVELFGDEVDSIRIFDPETQLSERKLIQVNIIPDAGLPEQTSAKIDLLDLLPSNTLFFISSYDFIRDRLIDLHENMELFLTHNHEKSNSESDDAEKRIFSLDDFTHSDTFIDKLNLRTLIEIGNPSASFDRARNFSFQVTPQPAFNRKFDLLIKDLQAHESAKHTIYIFAENPKQLERLYSIFADLKAEIQFVPVPHALHQGFVDKEMGTVVYTDHQIFQRYHKYKIKQAYSKSKAITLRALKELQPGDYVVHVEHGVGVFSGLQKVQVGTQTQEAVRIIYRDNDILYVNINSLHKISKYTGKEGHVPKVNKLGSDVWVKLKEKTKGRVKELAFDLIKLYAERKAQLGFAHTADNYLQTELEASFMYEDTPDQAKAVADVKKDMENSSPMDRLVCGDVGFGKTEVAIRAAFKTCIDGKQAAVLVPTTILAHQHYKTFSERLKDFPVTVDFINRFKSAKEKKETLAKVKEGKIDIVVGTHALLSKDVEFKNLGLLIIDEEQKFGVAHKEKIKTLKSNVDCLTLTATPIPRTLQFSLMGARDLSIINTPPPNRQPIQTEVSVFDEDQIRDAIYFE
ncbi:MAG: transcription-repair coupling factor, partial [Bacteroidota bacterium]